MPRGGNRRAFDDPMTLEQAFPGLSTAPGSSIVAVADSLFDFSGAAQALDAELTKLRANKLEEDIRELVPTFVLSSLTLESSPPGRQNLLNKLRFERAAAFLRVRQNPAPLQTETLRFVQRASDIAYANGLKLLRANKLPIRLSGQEALGNYIDRQVRQALRFDFNKFGIEHAGRGPVRVNARESNNSETDLTFRRPDARVGSVAFDVTLSKKTIKTPHVQGFFATDWRPSHVVIVRPRQLGDVYTYSVVRPENVQ